MNTDGGWDGFNWTFGVVLVVIVEGMSSMLDGVRC